MERKSQSLFNQSVSGNLKFWGKLAEMVFLIFVLLVSFYTFFVGLSLSFSGEESVKELARQFKIYAVMMGLIMPLIGIKSYGVPGIGITLSLGARRSETLWGLQFMGGLLVLQVFLFVAMGNWLTGGSSIWMKMYLPIPLIGVGVGELSGCANLRFGWKGGLMTFLFAVAIAFGGGSFFVSEVGLALIRNGQIGKLFLALLLVAILLLVAGVCWWKKILSAYEVKL